MPQPPTIGLFYDWRFFLRLRLRLQAALEPLGLPIRDFFLLSMVRQKARPQRELAIMCGLDPSSMVPVVDALEARGWIERRRHPRDRRVHLVTLSEAGKKLHTRALRVAKKIQSERMANLNEEDREMLLRLLRKLVDD